MSTMMSHDMILRFKALFEEQRERLIYSQAVLNEEFNIQRDDLIDDLDMTSAELETGMRMRLRNREALYLKKIDEALRRIEDGCFGSCEQCEEDIELKRLEARPTTTLCVTCKERSEQREKLHIDGHRPKSLGQKLRLA
jgi:DnaK suppressor protein